MVNQFHESEENIGTLNTMRKQISTLSHMPYNHWIALLMVLSLVVSVFFPTREMISEMGNSLPHWAIGLVLVVEPILPFITVLPDRMRPELRFFSLLLFLGSISLNKFSWSLYPFVTAAVLALVYLEVFWLIPKLDPRSAFRRSS